MNGKNSKKIRVLKKIRIIRKKSLARCNLNVELKKMITEVFGNA